jgi:hypothetical protein
MMTVQAKRLRDALCAVGLKHGSWRSEGDFTVSTETTRRRDVSSGLRYSEYGDASSHLQSRTAMAKVAEYADSLAAQELSVILCYSGAELVTAVVSSKHNAHHEVSILRDGDWTRRRQPAPAAFGTKRTES